MNSVILKNIVDLSINDVNDLCPDCNSLLIKADPVVGSRELMLLSGNDYVLGN
jgi:hypothetical protein